MKSVSIPPVLATIAFVPMLVLAAGAVVAAIRWEPPRHAVDTLWLVLGVEAALIGAGAAIWLAMTGEPALAEVAAAGALGATAATVWLDRAAAQGGEGDDRRGGDDDGGSGDPRGPEGDTPEWESFERAFRSYAAAAGERASLAPVRQ